jgi:hypothetical protein
MKIAKEIPAKVPFRSGNDDEEPPTPLLQLIDDLLEMKTSFESIQTGVKDGTLAKKKKDREAAKAIQQASLGAWVARKASSSSTSDSESDASNKPPKKRPIQPKSHRQYPSPTSPTTHHQLHPHHHHHQKKKRCHWLRCQARPDTYPP